MNRSPGGIGATSNDATSLQATVAKAGLIEADTARFIRLGPGGSWAARCLAAGELRFGFPEEPHKACFGGDWAGARQDLLDRLGKKPADATSTVREFRDFHTLGSDCMWITFFERHLWWTFATGGAELAAESGQGALLRPVRPWSKHSLAGVPLSVETLSTRLTQVGAYQRTICAVGHLDYLLRRINDQQEPMIAEARLAVEACLGAAARLIEHLHWSDFEVLADLLLARSGWQRVSMLGKNQADLDLIVEQPATRERAFVQVKSKADQATLDRWIDLYRLAAGYDRMFFICHSPQGRVSAGARRDVHVWAGRELAERAMSAGLLGWLMERAS